jgi:hypothetical protein
MTPSDKQQAAKAYSKEYYKQNKTKLLAKSKSNYAIKKQQLNKAVKQDMSSKHKLAVEKKFSKTTTNTKKTSSPLTDSKHVNKTSSTAGNTTMTRYKYPKTSYLAKIREFFTPTIDSQPKMPFEDEAPSSNILHTHQYSTLPKVKSPKAEWIKFFTGDIENNIKIDTIVRFTIREGDNDTDPGAIIIYQNKHISTQPYTKDLAKKLEGIVK